MLNRLLLLVVVVATSLPSFSQTNYVDFVVRLSYPVVETSNPNNPIGTAGVEAANRTAAGGSGQMDMGTAIQITVQVIAPEGGVIAEGRPDTQGTVRFRVLGSQGRSPAVVFASYRVRVYGPEIEEEWAEDVQPGLSDRTLMITLRRKGEKAQPKSKKATVSASEFNIPKNAQKELERGNKALQEGKLDVAKIHFEKAVAIYPKFDQAQNNLGIVLVKSGDVAGAKAAFEQALSVNNKFAGAYVNLAKLSMQDKDYENAILLTGKALSVEPMNPEAVSILCQADALTQRFEDVIAASSKLHGLAHEGMNLCHFAAGVAYTNLQRPADAVAEYNLYLKESKSTDALIPKAQAAIEELNKRAAGQQQQPSQ